MKTPEEIKRGLVCCGIMTARDKPCAICPYRIQCQEQDEPDYLLSDTFAYINQLEERIALLEERISLMKIQMQGDCGTCRFRLSIGNRCHDCMEGGDDPYHPLWEYEGLPLEVTIHEKPV